MYVRAPVVCVFFDMQGLNFALVQRIGILVYEVIGVLGMCIPHSWGRGGAWPQYLACFMTQLQSMCQDLCVASTTLILL